MLTTISQYLKQRIQALNYIQQVYGIGQLLQVNGEQVPSIKINGEDTHVNFDNYKSLVFFLKNGNVGHSAEEHPFLANADLITKTYPLRLILYSQVLENTDCNSLSQSLADNIISALNGEQAAFKASVSVDRCRIEFGNTDLEKYSVWESLYSIDSVLKDTDVLIAIEFTVTVTGLESCFTDSPCEAPEFTFNLEKQTFCEKVETCLGISETGSTTEYLNRRGEWATPAGGGGASWGGITGTLSSQTDLNNALNSKEATANKTDSMSGNTGSSTMYLSAKGVYDWVVSLGYITTAALSGYLTSATAAATYQIILTASNLGSLLNGFTSKDTPVDADSILLSDSAASNAGKKLTWANLKTALGLTAWVDYSSATVVGWSSTTEKNIRYSNNPLTKLVVLHVGIAGTSNSTAVTIPLPFAAKTGIGSSNATIQYQNNGAFSATAGAAFIVPDTDANNVLCYTNFNQAAWSASNGKTVRFKITYEAA